LTKPLIRKPGMPKSADFVMDPANPLAVFREATWDEALELAGGTLRKIRDAHGGGALADSARQGLERGSVSLPEARAHGLRLEQRRPLHAALSRVQRGRRCWRASGRAPSPIP
jgi:anaerobic selenocysteine-containing dehydrogenase